MAGDSSDSIRKAYLLVAEHLYGRKGIWAYKALDFINDRFFDRRLPCTHIQWELTPYGRCFGFTSAERQASAPVINLHPSLLGSGGRNPWDIAAQCLGQSFAFDTLLHECMHVHIQWNLGGQDGRSSHECKRWIAEVNRLAPMLGFDGIEAGLTKLVRVPNTAVHPTARGKGATRVERKCLGNVPFAAVAGFPGALRSHLDEAYAYYTSNRLPIGAPQLDFVVPSA